MSQSWTIKKSCSTYSTPIGFDTGNVITTSFNGTSLVIGYDQGKKNVQLTALSTNMWAGSFGGDLTLTVAAQVAQTGSSLIQPVLGFFVPQQQPSDAGYTVWGAEES